MTVSLVWVTPDAENHLLYCARVSSAKPGSKHPGLMRYLINHKHWSPFEMVSMCVEINTSRSIGRQILRHRSFSFQEFSQRYQRIPDLLDIPNFRLQATTNRQSSSEALSPELNAALMEAVEEARDYSRDIYSDLLKAGVAREQARVVLPEGLTPSRMFMSGTLRSWIHYLEVRDHEDTQLEHRDVAREIKALMAEHFPITFEALNWHSKT